MKHKTKTKNLGDSTQDAGCHANYSGKIDQPQASEGLRRSTRKRSAPKMFVVTTKKARTMYWATAEKEKLLKVLHEVNTRQLGAILYKGVNRYPLKLVRKRIGCKSMDEVKKYVTMLERRGAGMALSQMKHQAPLQSWCQMADKLTVLTSDNCSRQLIRVCSILALESKHEDAVAKKIDDGEIRTLSTSLATPASATSIISTGRSTTCDNRTNGEATSKEIASYDNASAKEIAITTSPNGQSVLESGMSTAMSTKDAAETRESSTTTDNISSTDTGQSIPTAVPTTEDSSSPTTAPTTDSRAPTTAPTTDDIPSTDTSQSIPTAVPTTEDSSSPTTAVPSTTESSSPTTAPTTEDSSLPTTAPTTDSSAPTAVPTTEDSSSPTTAPTTEDSSLPTTAPTTEESSSPTRAPTTEESSSPTTAPTTDNRAPTTAPTTEYSSSPTTAPTTEDSSSPTTAPTTEESSSPTTAPTTDSRAPTTEDSSSLTTAPTTEDSSLPTTAPTTDSRAPITSPTTEDSSSPTTAPTTEESSSPTTAPTTDSRAPTTEDSSSLTTAPTTEDSSLPTTAPTTDSRPPITSPTTEDSSSTTAQATTSTAAVRNNTLTTARTTDGALSTEFNSTESNELELKPDYSAIYTYIGNLMQGEQNNLGPLESLVVLDCLKTVEEHLVARDNTKQKKFAQKRFLDIVENLYLSIDGETARRARGGRLNEETETENAVTMADLMGTNNKSQSKKCPSDQSKSTLPKPNQSANSSGVGQSSTANKSSSITEMPSRLGSLNPFGVPVDLLEIRQDR